VADGSLLVIVSVLIASLLLAVAVVRASRSSTSKANPSIWRRSEIHRNAVIVKRHLARAPEVFSMGGPPLKARTNVPTRQSFRSSTAVCVLGWIAWAMSVSALLAVVVRKALP
jgi:hypothetical protein